jgi:hypothetical protein
MFGGIVGTAQVTNTIFQFDLDALMFAWVGGSLATGAEGKFGPKGVSSQNYEPPALYGVSYWSDTTDRKLYIFGGIHIAAGTSAEKRYADMWMFDYVSWNFTWIHGPGTQDTTGTYGFNQTVFAENLIPGARAFASFSYDKTNKIGYLFGGSGWARVELGNLNDLWAYDFNSNIWAWYSGSFAVNPNGAANQRNVWGDGNVPRARFSAHMAFNPSKNQLYIYGGANIRSNQAVLLSDLWKYSLDLNLFAWVGGSFNPTAGSFGTKGVSSPSNYPGAKADGAYCYDTDTNRFWVHGGFKTTAGAMNDLWFFVDDLPEPVLQDSTEMTSSENAYSTTSTNIVPRDRKNFAAELNDSTAGISTPAIIGISGAVAFLLVVGALVLMLYIKRQSYKEAMIAEAKTAPGESTTVDATGLSSIEDGSLRSKAVKLGSSTLDLGVVKTPSPLVKYKPDSVAESKRSVQSHSSTSGEDFDCVLQFATQNGSALYNAMATGASLKSRGDRFTVKLFGKNVSSLEPSVEDAFWEEAALLIKLRTYDISISSFVSYCLEPVALIMPAYPLGTLETYLTQQSSISSADVYNIVTDVAKALKVLHELGYAHRNVKLRNVFVQNDKGIHGVLTGFGGLQRFGSDDAVAAKAFPNYRIDAKAANFVAPEVFNALRGQVPSLNVSSALKAGDLFSWAMLVSKMLKSLK